MDYLFAGCLFVFLVLSYGFCSCLVATEHQARKWGIWGWPARVIFFFFAKFRQLNVWLCRISNEEIEVQYLPKGKYTRLDIFEVGIFVGHLVYDFISEVKDEKDRTYTVLSKRPLPKSFEVIVINDCNIIKKVA